MRSMRGELSVLPNEKPRAADPGPMSEGDSTLVDVDFDSAKLVVARRCEVRARAGGVHLSDDDGFGMEEGDT